MNASRRPTVVVFGEARPDLGALAQALALSGAEVVFSTEREAVADADGLVIAFDCSFADAMSRLRDSRGDELFERRIAGGRPVLAVGVGMHVMFDGSLSDEQQIDGLAQWPGVVTDLEPAQEAPAGDTTVVVADGSTLFAGIESEDFTFDLPQAVHEWTLEVYGAFNAPRVSYANLGTRVVAAVENGPLTAVQFHPERSGKAGQKLLHNWVQSL